MINTIVNDVESATEFVEYIKEENLETSITYNSEGYIVKANGYNVLIPEKYKHVIKNVTPKSPYSNKLIFGKNVLEEIVSIEVYDSSVFLYFNNGTIQERPMVYWVLSDKKFDKYCKRLEGDNHYKYIKTYTKQYYMLADTKKLKGRGIDFFTIYNEKEAAMIYYGFTMFKGLKVKDVSVLSFDIEASGLNRDKDSKVFLITNTFRDSQGNTVKKHFRVDNYSDNDVEMIEDWCKWVVDIDPTVITGHNVFGYDFSYLEYCYRHRDGVERTSLPLGKDHYPIRVDNRESSFRVDGATTWEYKKIHIKGRHIIDGMFLAVKYDIGRKYKSWGLKPIAQHEGFIKEDRQFYDASQIYKNWYIPEEREKIIAYGLDDADDSLAIYDLMVPSIFYMTQSVPKPFQLMGLSASGGQLNAVMVRSYLQENHSIPKADERTRVAGGMSYGVPGIYSNVVKFDAASFYPSTILAFNITNNDKDPKNNYINMVKYFTEKRFEQKDKYKETGDTYYNDLQAASKIFINSSYGLLGTNGLNFNSFEHAALITKCCRKGLQKAVIWATGKPIEHWWEEYGEEQDFEDYSYIDKLSKVPFSKMNTHNWILCNIDTDALSFAKEDGSEFSTEEKYNIQKELNDIMYSDWEDDGEYSRFIVLKAKNYVTLEKGTNKIKYLGSSLKDSKKEPALKEMTDSIFHNLLYTKGQSLTEIYEDYIKETMNIQDISRWCVKKSITKAVLNPTRSNEQKVLDALEGVEIREGDKVYLYTALDGQIPDVKNKTTAAYTPLNKDLKPKMVDNNVLKIADKWQNDEYKKHYLSRVYKTVEILKNVVDMEQFTKYHLSGSKKKLEKLLDEEN